MLSPADTRASALVENMSGCCSIASCKDLPALSSCIISVNALRIMVLFSVCLSMIRESLIPTPTSWAIASKRKKFAFEASQGFLKYNRGEESMRSEVRCKNTIDVKPMDYNTLCLTILYTSSNEISPLTTFNIASLSKFIIPLCKAYLSIS